MQFLIINIVIVIIFGGIIYSTSLRTATKNKLFLVLSFFQLLYVHSMVEINSVPDLWAYKDYFASTRYLSFSQSFVRGIVDSKIEVGYIVFFRIIGYFTSEFRVFLITYSFILLILYYNVIRKESPYVFCSVLLLLVIPFNQSLFVIRQHLAAAIMIASFPLVKDRKLVKFLLLNSLAALMHNSAIIFVLVYFIYGIKGKKTKTTLISIAVVMIFLFITIAGYVGRMIGKYQTYLDNDEGQNITGVFISAALLFSTLVIMKEKVWKEGINRFSFVLIYIYFILCVGGLGFDPTGRLTVYFFTGVIFIIPISMSYIKTKFLRNLYFLIVFLLYFYIAFFRGAGEHVKNFALASFS